MEFELQNSKLNAELSNSWLDSYRDELNAYYKVLKSLNDLDPIDIFKYLSAFSARCSEMRMRLHRSDERRAMAFRTKEIEPLIEEIDRQFKIHSRILSFQEMEWKMSGERGRGL